jgi:hypothetical protein
MKVCKSDQCGNNSSGHTNIEARSTPMNMAPKLKIVETRKAGRENSKIVRVVQSRDLVHCGGRGNEMRERRGGGVQPAWSFFSLLYTEENIAGEVGYVAALLGLNAGRGLNTSETEQENKSTEGTTEKKQRWVFSNLFGLESPANLSQLPGQSTCEASHGFNTSILIKFRGRAAGLDRRTFPHYDTPLLALTTTPRMLMRPVRACLNPTGQFNYQVFKFHAKSSRKRRQFLPFS